MRSTDSIRLRNSARLLISTPSPAAPCGINLFQPLRQLFVVSFMIVLVSACSAGTILGYSEAEWMDALASGRSLPFPADARLSELTRLGPGTLLFMAMQAEDRQDEEAARRLLSAAAAHETGLYARFAADRYVQLLKDQADGPGLLAFSVSEAGRNLLPWTRAITEAEALSMAGLHAQALDAWNRLLDDFPQEAADNPITVHSGRLRVAMQLETPESTRLAVNEFRLLMGMNGTAAWYKAMSGIIEGVKVHPAVLAALSQYELQLAQARVLSGSRDYGAAVLAFRRCYVLAKAGPVPALLDTPGDPTLPGSRSSRESANTAVTSWLSAEAGAQLVSGLDRPALSDLARAFLFGSRSEGEAIFALLASKALESVQSAGVSPGSGAEGMNRQPAYLQLFWAGRFARAAERWSEAASLFSAAVQQAPAPADLDAALWYEAEARSKYSLAEAVAVLARAYESTSNPAYYSDLLEPLSRKALAERSGAMLAAIITAANPDGNASSGTISPGATPRDRARLDYLGARAAATGLFSAGQLGNLVSGSQDISADSYIAAALNRAYRQDADPWYRLLAAYRLGLPLVEAADGPGSLEPPPGPRTASTVQDTAAQGIPGQDATIREAAGQVANGNAFQTLPIIKPETPGEADSFARGMIRFGLAGKARTELGPAYLGLEPSTIRAVAEALVKTGDYGLAIRAIAPLFSRTGYVPSRQDRELYWPKAFPDEIQAAAQRFSLPEALLSGLVRSESLFQPEVVSSAGAVGLAQLLPSTAAEIAGRIRMTEYDITNPEDNLILGASYFKRILDSQSGRFMPAIFSYNAGPTRFRRWENQYGPMPLDLLLEVLDYAETRQYGRNVVAATMAYAALYYAEDLQSFMTLLLGE